VVAMKPALPWLALLCLLTASLVLSPAAGLPVDTGMGPEPYHVWPYLTADLAALSLLHSDIARWYSAGRSTAQLDLWVLEITNFADLDGTEPVVYFDGGHHGNEQLGMEATYAVALKLLNGYGEDPAMTAIVEDVHLFLVPSINPDGNLANTRKNLNQVDLNRNYPWHWGEPGCSHQILSGTYCGPSPASEAEVQVNIAFVRAIRPELYVTMHTGTTAFIYPWSYTTLPTPHAATYQSISQQFTALTGIESGQASTELYIASGTSKDWAYGEVGALSWTLEVHGEQGRILSVQDIETRIGPSIDGLFFLLNYARANL
jgi:predicted deacylase